MRLLVSAGMTITICAAICASVAVATTSACVTVPPPELPELPVERPTIVHDAVVPPTDQILPALPVEFVVPVELDDPAESFLWDVFVDYSPCAGPTSCALENPKIFPQEVQPTAGTLDGGVYIVSFALSAPDLTTAQGGPSACHRIDFLVAHGFNQGSEYTWDSVGGDIVTWFFNAGGGPNGCPVYDAGNVQDGAFPPVEAGADALPVIPESGTSEDP
jgi:hypothetical protein